MKKIIRQDGERMVFIYDDGTEKPFKKSEKEIEYYESNKAIFERKRKKKKVLEKTFESNVDKDLM